MDIDILSMTNGSHDDEADLASTDLHARRGVDKAIASTITEERRVGNDRMTDLAPAVDEVWYRMREERRYGYT